MLIVDRNLTPNEIIDIADRTKPKYIFFPFYSSIIPQELYDKYNCVVFHMTDLPYGRGGTPLQNLILRGHKDTVISAIKVNKIVDGGDIYLKKPLLLCGTAEEIYMRAKEIITDMIHEIVDKDLKPEPQNGKPVNFIRRTPKDSDMTTVKGLENIHDFIRMLDSEGYPKAFIEHNGIRMEFSRSSLKKGHIIADVKITCRSGSR